MPGRTVEQRGGQESRARDILPPEAREGLGREDSGADLRKEVSHAGIGGKGIPGRGNGGCQGPEAAVSGLFEEQQRSVKVGGE